MRRALPLCFLLLGTTAPLLEEGGGDGALGSKQKLVNLVSFDLAVCSPPVETIADARDGAVVTGVLLSARPAVVECLVGPSSRGAALETKVVVDVSIDASAVRISASGDNLTASGKACIEGAVAQAPWKPLPKGSRSVSGSITVQHGPTSPLVRFGVNEASDVAGKVRLALKDFCDCFKDVGTQAPPELEAKLTVKKGRVAAASFDHNEGKLAACMLPKLQAMDFLASAQELVVPIPLLLLNSLASTENAQASPETQFSQLDAIRGRRASRLAMSVGARNIAVVAYDAQVAQYKKKAGSVPLKQLKDSCGALVKADEALIDATQKQVEVDERTLALASRLSGTDKNWAQAARAAQTQVDNSKADLVKAQAAKAADAAVCPKETY
jgi:hypothetical protein